MNSEIWLFMTRELQFVGDLACSSVNQNRAGSALGSFKSASMWPMVPGR